MCGKSLTLAVAIVALIGVAPAGAQQAIKIGVILPYSGKFADTATQLDKGIKLYVKQHGDVVTGKKIEFIRKDVGGIAPDVAKRLDPASWLASREPDLRGAFPRTKS
ncbi:MAG: hypothetical protein WD871_00070 [Xanthobacteraceae bacterium]